MPSKNRVYFVNGTNQSLKCQHDDKTTNGLNWETPSGVSGVSENVDENFVSIQLTPFLSSQAGKYICKDSSGAGDQFEITVVAVEETKNQPKFEFPEPLEPLVCDYNFSATDGQDTKSAAEWYKDDQKISDLNDERFKVTPKGLSISDPLRTDSGVYTAKYNFSKTDMPNKVFSLSCEVTLTADPFVLPFEKSKNLIEEDKLELQCSVLGFPKSIVTWFKDGLKLNRTGAKLAPNNEGFENGHLIIEDLDFDDAGEYNCTATGANQQKSSQVIIVRVKSKMAALWPFLGIVGEVIILCLIICIYEKRRNKEADDSFPAVPENEHSEPKGNVRKRN